MERQELLPGKIFYLILLWLAAGCFSPEENPSSKTSDQFYKSTDSLLTTVNGLLLRAGKPFSGTLVSFYPGTTDTFAVSGYLNGKESGEWRQYYPTRQLKEKRFFEQGIKKGPYLGWWPGGQMQLEYNFEEGEYEGLCREWNETGFLVKKMNYRRGYEEGAQQWWYDNGKIKANYVIQNGRRYGLLGTKNCVNVTDSVFKR